MTNPHRPLRNMPFALVLVVLIFCVPSSGAKKRNVFFPHGLGPHIDSILSETPAQRGFWGIEVVRLRDGKVLFQQNADHLFMPASNMKLFTTAAALEKLGSNFLFRTTVESATAPDAQGRVDDLTLVGRGDANMGSRLVPYHLKTERKDPADQVYRELADQVAARGVREVLGNLVADDSYFLFEPYGHDWAEEDLEWGYGAPVTALTFNDNELLFHVQPAAITGETALVSLAPIADYYQINNHLETTEANSREKIFVERLQGSKQMDVWGQVPLGSTVEDDSVSIDNPPQLVGDMFLKLLEARGIQVRGHVVVKHFTRLEASTMPAPAPAPAGSVILAEHDSLGLREDIKVTNKVSQNLHAEMLLRTLGHEVKNFGSITTGLEVLRDFVAQCGIRPDDYYFNDGSGLSRKALVAPEAVIKLLEHMAASPNFNAYEESLPVAGVDGTLDHRFMGTSAAGAIHAKTGTITHVNSLSGYMDLPSGERLAFSIFGNSNPATSRQGARTVDQIALAIFEQFGGRKKISEKKRRSKETFKTSGH